MTNWFARHKVITVILAIIIIGGIGAITDSSNKNTTTQPTNINPTKAQAGDIDKFPALKDLLSGDNGDSQPKLRSIQYYSSSQTVNVDFNMESNLTAGLTKDGAKKEMSDIYIALYHDNTTTPVKSVVVGVWAAGQDKYGNQSYQQIYRTSLDKDVADKINWQQDKPSLELNIIPGLWDVLYGSLN